jgi:Cu-Zn family superoxide dismutase
MVWQVLVYWLHVKTPRAELFSLPPISMTKTILILLVCLLVSMTESVQAYHIGLMAKLKNAKGKPIGYAFVNDGSGGPAGTPAAEGVTVQLNYVCLSPGEYEIHFHKNGKCDGPDFGSAGGYLNGDAGDLPSLVVGKSKRGIETWAATTKRPKSQGALRIRDGGASLLITSRKKGGKPVACGVLAASMENPPTSWSAVACGKIKGNN